MERCGRSHGLEEGRQAIADVHAAGVSNWSLDLISGLPGTDLATWEASLKEALAARPTHISIYDLQACSTSAHAENRTALPSCLQAHIPQIEGCVHSAIS